jgi:anaphase-promoting complex subunit 5
MLDLVSGKLFCNFGTACLLLTLRTSLDVAKRLLLHDMKIRIYAKSGHASKGFTLALRTASIAERHFLLPILFKIVHGIAVILLDQTEYEAAKELCEAALPKVR